MKDVGFVWLYLSWSTAALAIKRRARPASASRLCAYEGHSPVPLVPVRHSLLLSCPCVVLDIYPPSPSFYQYTPCLFRAASCLLSVHSPYFIRRFRCYLGPLPLISYPRLCINIHIKVPICVGHFFRKPTTVHPCHVNQQHLVT